MGTFGSNFDSNGESSDRMAERQPKTVGIGLIAAFFLANTAATAFGQLADDEIDHSWAVSPLPGATESDWIAYLAEIKGGESENRLPDGTRGDIVTNSHAYEVEWANPGNQYAAFGQATYYALWTGKKPAVILLVRGSKDAVTVIRTKMLCLAGGVECEVVDVR